MNINDEIKIGLFHLAELPVGSHKGGPRGLEKSKLAIHLVVSISFFVSISIPFCIILRISILHCNLNVGNLQH